ncbi:MAG: hypothetical protein IJF71_06220 [Clostridia bacterium]|nr:hypothetical protein [Clostridia bacterium]
MKVLFSAPKGKLFYNDIPIEPFRVTDIEQTGELRFYAYSDEWQYAPIHTCFHGTLSPSAGVRISRLSGGTVIELLPEAIPSAFTGTLGVIPYGKHVATVRKNANRFAVTLECEQSLFEYLLPPGTESVTAQPQGDILLLKTVQTGKKALTMIGYGEDYAVIYEGFCEEITFSDGMFCITKRFRDNLQHERKSYFTVSGAEAEILREEMRATRFDARASFVAPLLGFLLAESVAAGAWDEAKAYFAEEAKAELFFDALGETESVIQNPFTQNACALPPFHGGERTGKDILTDTAKGKIISYRFM